MVLLEKLWEDIVDRSDTNCRLAGLRKINTPPLIITDVRGAAGKYKRTKSVPAGWSAAVNKTPTEPVVCKDSNSAVWGSVFFPVVEENHSAASSAGVQLHPGDAFFNKSQPQTGLWNEEAVGKQSLVT